MQLQKQVGKKVGSKIYPKYVIVIPPEMIEKSELKVGDKLEGEASKHQIVLKKLLK